MTKHCLSHFCPHIQVRRPTQRLRRQACHRCAACDTHRAICVAISVYTPSLCASLLCWQAWCRLKEAGGGRGGGREGGRESDPADLGKSLEPRGLGAGLFCPREAFLLAPPPGSRLLLRGAL